MEQARAEQSFIVRINLRLESVDVCLTPEQHLKDSLKLMNRNFVINSTLVQNILLSFCFPSTTRHSVTTLAAGLHLVCQPVPINHVFHIVKTSD